MWQFYMLWTGASVCMMIQHWSFSESIYINMPWVIIALICMFSITFFFLIDTKQASRTKTFFFFFSQLHPRNALLSSWPIFVARTACFIEAIVSKPVWLHYIMHLSQKAARRAALQRTPQFWSSIQYKIDK